MPPALPRGGFRLSNVFASTASLLIRLRHMECAYHFVSWNAAMKTLIRAVLSVVVCVSATTSLLAQGEGDIEARFIAMLKNATLKGSWAPVQQNKLGADRGGDSYRIARAEKNSSGQWSIVSIFNAGGQNVEYPIPATVKFAGDTAVLILDNVRAG